MRAERFGSTAPSGVLVHTLLADITFRTQINSKNKILFICLSICIAGKIIKCRNIQNDQNSEYYSDYFIFEICVVI